ncbi:MAG: serine/threonine protein kinase [Deltaproteobacteria bacterium]|nr:serine/threonine protein kinase [Deltaproteobacteria bacterium]
MTRAFDGSGELLLGRYRIVERIGSGGQAQVFLARSEGAAGFVRPVAVKRFRSSDGWIDDEEERRFVREAKILSDLRHPGIVGVVEFARDDDGYMLVLDYVHGYSLRHWLKFLRAKGRRLPVEVACLIIIQVLDALHYAHERVDHEGQPLNIIHRDIAPDNVLIDVEGRAKLADFGIARIGTEVTATGLEGPTVKGKFPYLAPELLLAKPPSRMSDLYAAALVLHEALGGKNEFRGPDPQETMRRVLKNDPVRLDRPELGVPTEIANLVIAALTKDPTLRAARFHDVSAFAEALRAELPTSERDAAALMAKVASKDFLDPEMVYRVRVKPLAKLEAAWRDGGPVRGAQPRPLESVSVARKQRERAEDRATVRPAALLDTRRAAETMTASIPTPAPSRRRGRLIPALVLLGSLGGAAIIAWVVISSQPRGPRPDAPVVLVRGDVVMDEQDDASDPGAAIADASAASDNSDNSDSGPIDTAPTEATSPEVGRPSMGDRRPDGEPNSRDLSRVFARRNTRFARCFNSHAAGAGAVPRMNVDVEIATNGRVSDVQLHPSSLNGTALGRCITAVTTGTRFPRQSQPVAIRFPLSVSSR